MIPLLQIVLYSSRIRTANNLSDSSSWGFNIAFFSPFVIFLILYIYMRLKKSDAIEYEVLDPNIIILAAIIIKEDNQVSVSELKKVKKLLDKILSAKKSETYYQYLKKSIHQELSLAKTIRATNLNIITDVDDTYKLNTESNRIKINWLHFLISVAVADRVMTNKELDVLNKIRIGWDFPLSTFNSLLAMFNYYTEDDLNRQKQVKTYTESSFRKYYSILELDDKAPNEEIKTSYRRLVKKYHPDKNIDSSSIKLKLAKQKFQAIQEAYEKLKKHKGFN